MIAITCNGYEAERTRFISRLPFVYIAQAIFNNCRLYKITENIALCIAFTKSSDRNVADGSVLKQ